MKKECCNKIKNYNEEDAKIICIDCVNNLKDLIGNLGIDKDIWLESTIEEIKTCDKFYCIYSKKLNEIVYIVYKKADYFENEFTDLLNDIKYALHDIQAPIRSIRSFSEMILNSVNNKEEAEDLLLRINSASVRVTDMLNDMKDIMILGKKKAENIRVIDFNQIIEDVKDNLHNIISKRNAKIFIDCKNSPKIRSNILRWTRIFQNLIINAILYNKSEKPTIKIWFEENKIFVQDNGIGIPKDKYDAVFEMFTRLSDRQNMADGTGAGLFMCRKFLNMDGYSINIYSSDENGTTFIISYD